MAAERPTTDALSALMEESNAAFFGTISNAPAKSLTLQISQLEHTVEALEKRVTALEQHNALSIEELEAELARRYDRHTRNVPVVTPYV